MILQKGHIRLMLRLEEQMEKEGVPLIAQEANLSDEEWEYLSHLVFSGLAVEESGAFFLTQPGYLLTETLREAIRQYDLPDPEEWPETFRWVGSEVLVMIEAAQAAGGRTRGVIEEALVRRGFARDGHLTPLAEVVLSAYRAAVPSINVTREMGEFLRKMPPGPAEVHFLPSADHMALALEAQRMLSFSPPDGQVYALSGLGQQIRAALIHGAPSLPVLVDERILQGILDLRRGPLERTLFERLVALAYVDEKGELLEAGKHLLAAARIYLEEPITDNPSVHLPLGAVRVLKAIGALEEAGTEPTEEALTEQLKKVYPFESFSLPLLLVTLEGYRLIAADLSGSEAVYRLTDWGRRVYEDQKEREREIPALGVKAITMTRMEYQSPEYAWLKEAEAAGLVGKGFPSKSGRLYAELAAGVDRYPTVTGMETRVLKAMPHTRGLYLEEILAQFPEREHEAVREALLSLEGKTLVDALPGGVFVTTRPGSLVKRALLGVPESMELAITPEIVRVLDALRQVGEVSPTGRQIKVSDRGWREAVRISGISRERFESVVLAARRAHFLSSTHVTEAGVFLLQAFDRMKAEESLWKEVLV